MEESISVHSMADSGYLIFLGAGPQQELAYIRARELGIKTVAVDYNPQAYCFQLADRKIIASVKNADECIAALHESGQRYIGVITYGVDISPVVSKIAREFNLTGIPVVVAHNTTNKCARSRELSLNGIPIPAFEVIKGFSNSPPFDFPFVIKSSDNSGSRGVRMVRSLDEWLPSYNEALNNSGDGLVIAEELLIGTEISIEGFVVDGSIHHR